MDDVPVQCDPGMTVLQACAIAGVEIPRSECVVDGFIWFIGVIDSVIMSVCRSPVIAGCV